MPRLSRPPIKAACLSCCASKTRCDGQQPCNIYSHKGLNCSYRPSRRGGIQQGAKYGAECIATSLPPSPQTPISCPSVAQQRWPIAKQEASSPSPAAASYGLENIINHLIPSSGIQNLDTTLAGIARCDQDQVPHNKTSICELTGPNGPESLYLRAYASDTDILNAYYIYIHPFLSILPPTISLQYDDRPTAIHTHNNDIGVVDRSCLPYWPTSSLTLAISAILAVIPLPGDPHPFIDSSMHLRRLYAQLYAEAAFSEVEKEINKIFLSGSHLSPGLGEDNTDASIPSQLYPVLALVVLSVYKYCQRGNVSQIRTRANQAITTAMDLYLHNLGRSATEAQR